MKIRRTGCSNDALRVNVRTQRLPGDLPHGGRAVNLLCNCGGTFFSIAGSIPFPDLFSLFRAANPFRLAVRSLPHRIRPGFGSPSSFRAAMTKPIARCRDSKPGNFNEFAAVARLSMYE